MENNPNSSRIFDEVIILQRKGMMGFLPFLLLLVRNPSSFSLTLLDLLEVNSDGAVAEGVCLGRAAVLLEGGPEPPDEGIEAAPGLLERAGAGGGGIGLPEEDAVMQVDLGLPELV